MNTHLTLTDLRANLYQEIDRLIETGVAIEIERKGHLVKIIVESPKSKFDRLISRSVVVGDEEDLVHLDWSSTWTEKGNISK